MISAFRSLVFLACSIGWAVAILPGVSSAQANLNLVITEEPEEYVRGVLKDIEAEGVSVIRDEFERMGLNTPQSEAAISIYEGLQSETEKPWTDLMGVAGSGNALRQYYGYAFLGGNGWIFIRVDFLRRGDSEWILGNFHFDSNYASVVAPNFDFLD